MKAWKLKDENIQREFAGEDAAGSASFKGTWEEAKTIMLQTCEKTCGHTKRKRGIERETWWWNESVKRSITLVNTKLFF